MTLTQILGILFVAGSLLVIWANLHNTGGAGLRTASARWALIRRGLYCVLSWALFAHGVSSLNSAVITPMGANDFVYQVIILGGSVVFPVLRALDWTTQDMLLPLMRFRSNDNRPRARAHR